MKCDYQNREGTIAEYLMNRLSDEEAARFQEHFFNCDICFQELQLKKSAVNLVRTEGNVLFEDYLKRVTWQANFKKKLMIQGNKLIFVGAGLAFVLLVSFMLWFMEKSEPDILATIEYSQSVPVAYQPPDILLRGPAEIPQDLRAVWSFYERLTAAMLAYKDHDYTAAIVNLETIRPEADKLTIENRDDERALLAASQYYFYLGLSHLAVTRSKDVNLTQESETDHLGKAIQFLLKSSQLARPLPFQEMDKRRYFLGLAYGLAGKRELAVEQLKQIQSDDAFYKKSSALIKKWSNP